MIATLLKWRLRQELCIIRFCKHLGTVAIQLPLMVSDNLTECLTPALVCWLRNCGASWLWLTPTATCFLCTR